MIRDRQELWLDWQGLALSVTFERHWMGGIGGMSHIEVRSPDQQSLPITETGFRSIFVSAVILDEWDGPLPYLVAMLDAEAARPEWIAAQAKASSSPYSEIAAAGPAWPRRLSRDEQGSRDLDGRVGRRRCGRGRAQGQQEGPCRPQAVNTKPLRGTRQGLPSLRPEAGPARPGDPPPCRAVLTASPRSLPRG